MLEAFSSAQGAHPFRRRPRHKDLFRTADMVGQGHGRKVQSSSSSRSSLKRVIVLRASPSEKSFSGSEDFPLSHRGRN